MKIFPYTLVRFGGMSFDQWKSISYEDVNQMFEKIYSEKKYLEIRKIELSDNLFRFIKSEKDPRHQNILQNLRRDVFNNRRLRPSKIQVVETILPDHLSHELAVYLKELKNLEDLLEKGNNIYDSRLVKAREEFKLLIGNKHLIKGMVLSSHSLLDRINSYKETKINSFKTKEFRIEQSLIKYLTRMCAKTSPFSTFATLSIAELSTSNPNNLPLRVKSKTNTDKTVNGFVRMNNRLMKYLINLIKKYRKAYLHINLRANPTVKRNGNAFIYLTNSNNIESFQHIPYNQVLKIILKTVKKSTEGITFKNLILQLKMQIDAKLEEIEDYINQLIDFGFLEYNLGVSGIDPDWDVEFVKKLEPLKENGVPHIEQLINTLESIKNLSDRYTYSAADDRKQIVVEAFNMFRKATFEIHREASLPPDEFKTPEERQKEWMQKVKKLTKERKGDHKKDPRKDALEKEEQMAFKHKFSTFFNFKPEQIFYEDTCTGVTMEMDKSAICEFVGNLNNLLQELKIFRGMEEEKIKMKHFFKEKYKPNGKVPIIKFYKDYYKEFKIPETEWVNSKKKRQTHNPLKVNDRPAVDDSPYLIEPIKKHKALIDWWNDQYKKTIESAIKPGSDQIHVGLEDVKSVNKLTGIRVEPTKNCSYGSFVQFYLDDEGNLNGVVNSTFSGFGKMMSRFLHIFDEEITETLKRWNNSTNQENDLYIENCDSSYFNANVHPVLMPYEIWIPGGQNRLSIKKQFPVTDFEVAIDANSDELILLHKRSGKRAYIFDLGFQGHKGRSQLFQLLEKFSKAEYLFTNHICHDINQVYENQAPIDKEIIFHPRIIYSKQIILQRKCWYVPKEKIPTKIKTESNWIYYVKINTWREKVSIPEEVFIFINPDSKNVHVDPNSKKRLTPDDYKPQYINFMNPMLVALFEKSIAKIPKFLKIEEMLPNSKQMLKNGNERLVSECVIQWYC